MSNTTDWLSAAAAVVSAIGGSLAAMAAFQSARSAREAQQAADAAELRAARREIAGLAALVITEANRLQALVPQVKMLYRTLFTLSGTGHTSRLDLYETALDQKLEEVSTLKEDAVLFVDGAKCLAHAGAEELDRVHVRLDANYKRALASRELVEAERDEVSSQCTQRRESMDRTRLAR